VRRRSRSARASGCRGRRQNLPFAETHDRPNRDLAAPSAALNGGVRGTYGLRRLRLFISSLRFQKAPSCRCPDAKAKHAETARPTKRAAKGDSYRQSPGARRALLPPEAESWIPTAVSASTQAARTRQIRSRGDDKVIRRGKPLPSAEAAANMALPQSERHRHHDSEDPKPADRCSTR